MTTAQLSERLILGRGLDPEAAEAFIEAQFSETVGDATKGALLALLRVKGASGAELATFARALRARSGAAQASGDDLLDTCGTGGGPPTFNLSTAAAFVAAGAGAKVAKHGNRAVASSCGSADVLEALGAVLHGPGPRLGQILERAGIVFLFAPEHHPTMKRVGALRRELGFRTVFNQLGPLANPFGAARQLLGVYAPELVRPMADALAQLGSRSAAVVHGADGLDELSPCGPSSVAVLAGGEVEELTLSPEDFGLEPLPPSALAPAASAAGAAALLRLALADPDSPQALACLPNASAALVVAGLARTWREGAERARAAIADGEATRALQRFLDAAADDEPPPRDAPC